MASVTIRYIPTNLADKSLAFGILDLDDKAALDYLMTLEGEAKERGKTVSSQWDARALADALRKAGFFGN